MSTLLVFLSSCFSFSNILAVILLLCVSYYFYITKDYGKFEALGLKAIKPDLFHGNRKNLNQGKIGMMDFYKEKYEQLKGERCVNHNQNTVIKLFFRNE